MARSEGYRPDSQRSPLALAVKMSRWVRGPARIDDDQIVFDYTRAEPYYPDEVPDLPFALARTRTPRDVVKFVKRFGMLRAAPQYFDDEYIKGIPRDTAPTEAREPVAAFLDEGNKIRRLITAIRLLWLACREGDSSAVSKLRTWEVLETPGAEIREALGEQSWKQLRQMHKESRRSDKAFLSHVGLWLSKVLSEAVEGIRLSVSAGGSDDTDVLGAIRLQIQGQSLLDFCYLHFHQAFAETVAIGDCQECKGPFVITDRRMKFCGQACATTHRVRRFRQKSGGRKQRGKHGKTTRTRRG